MPTPTDAPIIIAQDGYYSSGPFPGLANKQIPNSGNIANGILPGQVFPAENMNYVLNNHGEWIEYLSSNSIMYQGRFGNTSASLSNDTYITPVMEISRGITNTGPDFSFPKDGYYKFDFNATLDMDTPLNSKACRINFIHSSLGTMKSFVSSQSPADPWYVLVSGTLIFPVTDISHTVSLFITTLGTATNYVIPLSGMTSFNFTYLFDL